MISAVYARVSTEEQRKHGISLEAQVSRCRQYAQAMGYNVIHTGIEAQSAKDTDRPELQTILALIAKKKIQHLLVIKLDRLSRDTEDAIRIGKQCAKKGVTLHLVAEGGSVDLTDPAQEMLFTMRAATSTFERKRIALNTKFALARKREKGERISRQAPFGYHFTEDGKVELDSHEQSIINRIHNLKASGFSIRAIQARLTTDGVLNRLGNPIGRSEIWNITKKAA